ncbi:LytR/AlgR family response regulator transcription factor [Thalassotalea fusca]
MTTINYLIIDDEPVAHKLIERFAKAHSTLNLVGQCYNAIEAKSLLAENSVALIFLDINMPQITGFEFLQGLQNPPQIIVVSAHQEYALESYEYEITDYLLKPFNAQRFNKAINKAIDKFALQASNSNIQHSTNTASQAHIFIKDDKKHHQVALHDISYIKANGNYTSVYLKESQLLSQMKISDFEKLLPVAQFSRVHRSYIVAHQALTLIKANELHIHDIVIPVGRVYKEKVSQLINKN